MVTCPGTLRCMVQVPDTGKHKLNKGIKLIRLRNGLKISIII